MKDFISHLSSLPKGIFTLVSRIKNSAMYSILRNSLACGLLILLVLFCFSFANAGTKSEVLGIRVGMSKEAAYKQLKKIGKLEREERKQQEIWVLNNNPHYSHLIVAFNKEYTEVRFITAKAKENGSRVRYSDVIDIKKAKQAGATNNYKYIQEIPPRGKTPGYVVTARGQDSNYLTYFSIEKID